MRGCKGGAEKIFPKKKEKFAKKRLTGGKRHYIRNGTREKAGKKTETDAVEKKKKREEEQEQSPQTPEEARESVSGEAEAARPEQDKAEELSQVKAELERVKAESEDFQRKWYLVSAEYENYRKRTAGVSAQRYADGRADVVKGLFPIADNLERAVESCTDESVKKGICMVLASFEALLKEEKIEVIDPIGQEFNAEEQEAIMAAEPEGDEQSGTVKQVYRKGYKQNGKVLRYAQVVVVK